VDLYGPTTPTGSTGSPSSSSSLIRVRLFDILFGPRLPLWLGSEVVSQTSGATSCHEPIRKFKDMNNVEVCRYV
jgi:hypothetical protein